MKEVRDRVQEDQFRIYAEQEPVFEPISFEEALARALKYNLDLRLKLMEKAQAKGLAGLANYDMLPDLLVTAGYTRRSNISGSYSYNIDRDNERTSDPTTPSYTGSQERIRRLADAEFSWSVLDFGIGYFRSKQTANELLIAEERRRRVVQNILSDVRSAYWRALGAQRLLVRADELTKQVKEALARSRQAEEQGLIPPAQALGYQRMLLDAVDLMASRRVELDLAKRELAALMNVTPGTEFEVTEIPEEDLRPAPLNVAELEEVALRFRPELRQEDYKARISADEARKQLLYFLPNFSVSADYQYDSNRYLHHVNWIDYATELSVNLINLFSIGATLNSQEQQAAADTTRRMALSMAVLTQVRVAIERYKLTLQELDVANDSFLVDQRMAAFAEAARNSQMNAELETIRAQIRALNSEFKRYGAYAAAQSAFGRIFNSVGFEVIPDNLDETQPLESIGKTITSHIKRVEDNYFAHASEIVEPVSEIKVVVNGIEADQKAALSERVSDVLSRNRFTVTDQADYTIRMSLAMNAASKGTRRASWTIEAVGREGQVSGRKTYTTTLTANPSPNTLRVFAESAVIANIGAIRGWLKSPQE